MKKSTILTLTGVALIIVIGLVLYSKRTPKVTTTVKEPEPELPVNTIPVEERPFITLAPDSTGRTLTMYMDLMPTSGEVEYEMIYDASGAQEGAFGTFNLTADQPIKRDILLGTKSGGGKISYHEGVTGGSLTLTFNQTRLKENWNYLKFDPDDPSFSSIDGKLNVTLAKTALKKDTYLTTMKTFGYSKKGLPEDKKIVTGPYSYYAQNKIKGSALIELKLPAGENLKPTIYEWDGTTWKKMTTKVGESAVTTTSVLSGAAYLVIAN